MQGGALWKEGWSHHAACRERFAKKAAEEEDPKVQERWKRRQAQEEKEFEKAIQHEAKKHGLFVHADEIQEERRKKQKINEDITARPPEEKSNTTEQEDDPGSSGSQDNRPTIDGTSEDDSKSRDSRKQRRSEDNQLEDEEPHKKKRRTTTEVNMIMAGVRSVKEIDRPQSCKEEGEEEEAQLTIKRLRIPSDVVEAEKMCKEVHAHGR